jgi:hypothetical protein
MRTDGLAVDGLGKPVGTSAEVRGQIAGIDIADDKRGPEAGTVASRCIIQGIDDRVPSLRCGTRG